MIVLTSFNYSVSQPLLGL